MHVSSRLACLALCCVLLGSCGTSTADEASASRQLLNEMVTHSVSLAVNRGATFETQASFDVVAPPDRGRPLEEIAIPGFKVTDRWREEASRRDMQYGEFSFKKGLKYCHLSIHRLDQAHTVIALAGFDVPRLPLALQDAFKRVEVGEAQYLALAADCRSKAWSPRA